MWRSAQCLHEEIGRSLGASGTRMYVSQLTSAATRELCYKPETWQSHKPPFPAPDIILLPVPSTRPLVSRRPATDWNGGSISLSSKIRLMRSLVTSIFLYACESWTLTAELQRRIQAMKKRCYRKILRISYKDHVTNEEVCTKIQQSIGPHENLTIVKRRKLQWYSHVSRSSGLAIKPS